MLEASILTKPLFKSNRKKLGVRIWDLCLPAVEFTALFSFTDRISVRREVLDGNDRDEGIAEAIDEEGLIARWDLTAG